MPMFKVNTDSHHPVEIYYEDHGSGKPIVLIHGWPLSGRSWEAQVPALIAWHSWTRSPPVSSVPESNCR